MQKAKSGIWITGASSGIGRAAAKEFARIGCQVFATSRRESELERLNAEMSKEKLKIEIFPCNVASSNNVSQTVKKILVKGKINCLINNAGITSFKAAEANSITEIKDIINTNLLGSVYTIKLILPHMIENGGGTIINVLSVVTEKIFEHSTVYSASKAGLAAYTKSLREEVRKYDIRIVNIIPGATNTPIWSQEIRKTNSDRMMNPDDVARLMVWIYLQKSNLVTEEVVIRPIQGDL